MRIRINQLNLSKYFVSQKGPRKHKIQQWCFYGVSSQDNCVLLEANQFYGFFFFFEHVQGFLLGLFHEVPKFDD